MYCVQLQRLRPLIHDINNSIQHVCWAVILAWVIQN